MTFPVAAKGARAGASLAALHREAGGAERHPQRQDQQGGGQGAPGRPHGRQDQGGPGRVRAQGDEAEGDGAGDTGREGLVLKMGCQSSPYQGSNDEYERVAQ